MMRIEQRPLEQVAAGTPVAADVLDSQGNMLLKAGSVVSERLLEQLSRRGVTSLPVAVLEELTPEQRTARDEALEAELTQRFSVVREQPLMARLYDLVLRYRRESL